MTQEAGSPGTSSSNRRPLQIDPGLGLPGGPWGTQGELLARTAPPQQREQGQEPGFSPLPPAPLPLAPPRAGPPQEMTQTPFTQGLFQGA